MTSYLRSTRDFLYRRRQPLLIVGGLISGVYVAANYAVTKLSEMQRRMVEERRDRENLRRRFQQNQEDCSYTVLALLPTLGDQLFAYLDVEGLTSKLQKGRQQPDEEKAANGRSNGQAESEVEQRNGASILANGHDDKDERKANMEEVWNKLGKGSVEPSIDTRSDERTDEQTNNGTDRETTIESKHDERGERLENKPAPTGLDAVAEPAPLPIPPDARLTPSPTPTPNVASSEEAAAHSRHDNGDAKSEIEQAKNSAQSQDSAQMLRETSLLEEKRAKLALWNELKVAAFARTITALYGVVLLSLQTHVQLNLLGRYAYLTSVSSLSTSHDDAASADSSSQAHQIRLERNDRSLGAHEDSDHDEDDEDEDEANRDRGRRSVASNDVLRDGIDVQTERLYLTLSWWFLHRGWRALADLVEGAVHEVFDDVALKATLSHGELISMLRRVRRRVEFEDVLTDANGDGSSYRAFDTRSEWSEATTAATARRRGRRRNFTEILFPPPQQEVDVLIEAGALSETDVNLTGRSSSLSDLSASLPGLLDETRDVVESDDFNRVMRFGLQTVFGVFEDSLRPSFGLGPAHSDADDEQPQIPSIVELQDERDTTEEEAAAAAKRRFGKRVRLASLFPAVARQSTAIVHGVPNEYVDALANVKEFRAFCAVLYSAWS